MGHKTALIALFLVIAFVQPAVADWQYLRWGMTVDQALKASKGRLKSCDRQCYKQDFGENEARLSGDYSAGSFQFTVHALFNRETSKLSAVTLNLQDTEKGYALVKELRSKYGETVRPVKPGLLEAYVWRDAKNEITAIIIGGKAAGLRYQPRISEKNIGL